MPIRALIIALFLAYSQFSFGESLDGSCIPFLSEFSTTFDARYGFIGDRCRVNWISYEDERDHWQVKGYVHEIRIYVGAPGLLPKGDLKITTDSKEKIIQVQEMSSYSPTLIFGTQIDLKYNDDGYCLPDKVQKFTIDETKPIPLQLQFTETLFDLSACNGGQGPNCYAPGVDQALKHLDSPPKDLEAKK